MDHATTLVSILLSYSSNRIFYGTGVYGLAEAVTASSIVVAKLSRGGAGEELEHGASQVINSPNPFLATFNLSLPSLVIASHSNFKCSCLYTISLHICIIGSMEKEGLGEWKFMYQLNLTENLGLLWCLFLASSKHPCCYEQ